MTTGAINPAGLVPLQRYIVLSAAGISLPSPGVCKLKNVGSPRNWDIRPGYGISGATIFFMGNGISEFEVDIFIWEDPGHWIQWEAFSVLLTSPPSPPGTLPTSLGIGHPMLNKKPWLISKVVVADVGGWEVNDTGLWSLTIKFKQDRRAKPAGLAPLEGPPGTGPVVVPLTAQQQLNRDLDAQNAELRAKAGG